jgi:predicted phage terminase large subunit-like protein
MNVISPKEARRELIKGIRRDFPSFVRKVFNTLSPGHKFLPNWHIEAICHHIEQTLTTSHRRLIINIPPRYLKSIIASVALPAWLLGHDPTRSVICISYADDLARKFSRDFRRVVESPWYQDVFTRMRLDRRKISETEVSTTLNGSRLATSVRGTLTGRGGNFIIIDDALKAGDGESESERNFVNEWFDSTVVSRLNDKTNGVIIVVMQRLHENDLTGHLLEKPGWRQLSLPAIAAEDQQIEIGSCQIYNRIAGEVLHAGREPREALDLVRLQNGSRFFSAQYQQQPVPAEGAIIKAAWLKTSPKDLRIQPGDRVYQSWDVAAKVGTGNDWSVGTTWVVREREIHLMHVHRARMEFTELLRTVVAQADAFNPIAILIEDTSAGTAVLQTLEGTSKLNVVPIKVDSDKVVRVAKTTAMFEAGRIHVPVEAEWIADYTKELLAFPGSRYDDQVDSTSQFLNWLAENERHQIALDIDPEALRVVSIPWPDYSDFG